MARSKLLKEGRNSLINSMNNLIKLKLNEIGNMTEGVIELC